MATNTCPNVEPVPEGRHNMENSHIDERREGRNINDVNKTADNTSHGKMQEFTPNMPHQIANRNFIGKGKKSGTQVKADVQQYGEQVDLSRDVSENDNGHPNEQRASSENSPVLTASNNTDQEPDKKTKNFWLRKWRCFITIVILCMCIAGIIAALILIQHLKKNKLDDYNKGLPRIDALLMNCGEEKYVRGIGEHICYAPNTSCSQNFKNEVVKNITISQTFSRHFEFMKKYTSIVFSEDQFMFINDGWVVDYNLSRSRQPLQIGKLNLTCKDIGTYEVTLQYDFGQVISCKFDIATSYPLLNLSFTETEELINVSCELSDMCSDAYPTLLINHGNLTYPILADDEKDCGKSGRSKIKEVVLNKSVMAPNHTITCKPLTADIELTENLTSKLSFCNGRPCSKTCQEKEKGQYFQHQSLCNEYYHCEYPSLHLRPCPGEEQWNPESCSCDFANNVAYRCNNSTKEYIDPLDTSNIKGCGGS